MPTAIGTSSVEVNGKPAVATSDGKTYVFVRTKENKIYWKHRDTNGQWSPSETGFDGLEEGSAAVSVVNDLTAVGRSQKLVDLFTVDVEQRVQWRSYDGAKNTWGNWTALSDAGKYLSIVAAVTSHDSKVINLFVRRFDNSISHKRYTGTAWEPKDPDEAWTSMGSVSKFHGGPTATAADSQNVFVFARGGTDNALYSKRGSVADIAKSTASDVAWESLGGVLMGDVSAVSPDDNVVRTFHLGTNGAAYLKSCAKTDDKWKWDVSFSSLGGKLLTTPAARTTSDGTIYLFARWTNNHVYKTTFTPTASGTVANITWSSIPGGIWTAEPVLNPEANQVFLRSTTGVLYFYEY